MTHDSLDKLYSSLTALLNDSISPEEGIKFTLAGTELTDEQAYNCILPVTLGLAKNSIEKLGLSYADGYDLIAETDDILKKHKPFRIIMTDGEIAWSEVYVIAVGRLSEIISNAKTGNKTIELDNLILQEN